MKRTTLAAALMLIIFSTNGQNYPNILNYAINATPAYGIKIKTNLPFTSGSQMPVISILGYNYGIGSVMELKIVYYIFNNNFINYSISSAGNYTPKVYLAKENNKVVIYIDDKAYYQRFTVSAFEHGMGGPPAWFQGWTTADEPLSGSNITELLYKNRFGDIYFVNGSVGIGTAAPQERLSVNGKVRAKEVKVEAINWPDYVFSKDYKKPSLSELEQFISANARLPEIPSAKQVEKEGIELGAIQAALLKKIEELTLYIIEQDKQLQDSKKEIERIKQTLKRKNKMRRFVSNI